MKLTRLQVALAWPWTWVICWFFAQSMVIAVSLGLCQGHLIYSLDDPYIHLAVAETILEGGYGVNSDEYSSPSSSIAYPFCLVITEAVGLGSLGPLVLNLIAAGWGVYLFASFLIHRVVDPRETSSTLLTAAAMALALMTMSPLALPMTGMEHTWHVLFCIFTVEGLVRLRESNRASWPLIIGLVGMPLFRFEGFAFAIAGVIALAWQRQWLATLGTLALIALPVAIYAGSMYAMGLPVVPSSVLTKSDVAAVTVDQGFQGILLAKLMQGLMISLSNVHGWAYVIASVLLIARVRCGDGTLIGPVIAMTAAHVIAGRYGWFERYQVYVTATALMTLAYVYRDWIRQTFQSTTLLGRVTSLFTVFAIFILVNTYLGVTLLTPPACQLTYRQQYQMGILARDFLREPVAVNDLGLLSYRNPNYVLDLWGLGSEPVRKARSAGTFDKYAVDRVVSDHGVRFVMIYSRYFPDQIPDHWQAIGQLRSKDKTVSEGQVDFYITRPEDANHFRAVLKRFQAVLPEIAELEIDPVDPRGNKSTAPAGGT